MCVLKSNSSWWKRLKKQECIHDFVRGSALNPAPWLIDPYFLFGAHEKWIKDWSFLLSVAHTAPLWWSSFDHHSSLSSPSSIRLTSQPLLHHERRPPGGWKDNSVWYFSLFVLCSESSCVHCDKLGWGSLNGSVLFWAPARFLWLKLLLWPGSWAATSGLKCD